jgi:hypothetical protein
MADLAIRDIPTVAAPPRGYVGDLDHTLKWWESSPDHLYMAMKGFFDESGTHGAESPVVIVGGFVATLEQWDSYERDLRALFSEYGVKKYHAKDFRGRKGDFKEWSFGKRGRFNSRFLQLADLHLSFGVSTVLESDSYRNIYRSGDVVRTARRDTQYGLCIRAALWKTIVLMRDRKADWPVNFIFEHGSGNEGDAIRVFAEVRDGLLPEYASMFGSITFDTKEALPLAVADSLAYAIFRMHAGYSKHPTEPNAAVVGPADPPYYVHKVPLSRTLIDENTLAALRDGLRGEAV